MSVSGDPSDLEQRLTAHLRSTSSATPIGDTPVGAVIRRGRQRRARRRAAVGSLAAVATLAVTIGGVRVLTRPTPVHFGSSVIASLPSPTTKPGPGATAASTTTASTSSTASPTASPTSAPTGADAIGLHWTAGEPASGASHGDIVTAVPSPIGTTAFVVAKPASGGTAQLWSSDDGISWRATGVAPSSFVGRALASDGTTFYALGRAPAGSADTGRLVLDASTLGSTGFRTTALGGLDVSQLAALVGVDSVDTTADDGALAVAASSSGILAVAKPDIAIDLGGELNAEVADGAVAWITQQGVDVVAPGCAPPASGPAPVTNANGATCTPRVVAWSDIGVPEATVTAALAPPTVWFGADAGHIAPATSPTLPAGVLVTRVSAFAVGTRFALVLHTVDTSTTSLPVADLVYLSTDGTTWQPVTRSIDDIGVLAAEGDGTLVAASRPDAAAPAIAVSHDGGASWSVTGLADQVGQAAGLQGNVQLSGVAVGPTGITVAASISVDPFLAGGPQTITEQGYTISLTTSAGAAVFRDATGAQVGSWDGTSGSNVKLDPVSSDLILLDGSGAELVRLTAAQQQALRAAAAARFPARFVVLRGASDGTWTHADVATIAGFDARVDAIRATANGVQLTVTDRSSSSPTGAPRVVVLTGSAS